MGILKALRADFRLAKMEAEKYKAKWESAMQVIGAHRKTIEQNLELIANYREEIQRLQDTISMLQNLGKRDE